MNWRVRDLVGGVESLWGSEGKTRGTVCGGDQGADPGLGCHELFLGDVLGGHEAGGLE